MRDYYTGKTSSGCRWKRAGRPWWTVPNCCPVRPCSGTNPGKAEPEKMRTVGWLIDNAMEAIERENPKLKDVLNKSFAASQIESHKLADLIALFSDTNYATEYKGQPLSLKAKDILGHVYEYFLGQFAWPKAKGRAILHAKTIVSLIVNMLQPFKGRVYDPAVRLRQLLRAERRVHRTALATRPAARSASGKRATPPRPEARGRQTWPSAASTAFGGGHADTLLSDTPTCGPTTSWPAHPSTLKEWWNAKLESDPRWIAGTPPQGSANFAWLQHMLYHLAPTGGPAAGQRLHEQQHQQRRRDPANAWWKTTYVECMVALPGQLFTNTQIPACIWFLTKDKANGYNLHKKKRDRRQQFLFIDARQMGYMKDRVLRDFTQADIAKIADTFHAWQQGEGYENVKGFCVSASLDDIPQARTRADPRALRGRRRQEEDAEAFADKMARLTAQLVDQFAQA
ncbi:MAG: N-6 DNA methylase [Burkholderiaceae bacterium]